MLLSDWERGKSLKMLTYADKDIYSFDLDCKTAFSGDAETSWDSPRRFQHMKTNAKENCSGFFVQDLLSTFLQGQTLHSHWHVVISCKGVLVFMIVHEKKIIMPPSTLTFWVHVITISSLAWEWWKIPAASFYGEESSWNNLIYDDGHLSCRGCHLLLVFFLENFHVIWCRINFILTYHCAPTCKILSCLLLPFCLQRVWQITLQYETFLMGRKRDPCLENSDYTSQSGEKMICLIIVNST